MIAAVSFSPRLCFALLLVVYSEVLIQATDRDPDRTLVVTCTRDSFHARAQRQAVEDNQTGQLL